MKTKRLKEVRFRRVGKTMGLFRAERISGDTSPKKGPPGLSKTRNRSWRREGDSQGKERNGHQISTVHIFVSFEF